MVDIFDIQIDFYTFVSTNKVHTVNIDFSYSFAFYQLLCIEITKALNNIFSSSTVSYKKNIIPLGLMH